MARKIGSALMLVLLFGSMLFPMIMLTGGKEPHDIVVMLANLGFLYNHLESKHTMGLDTIVFNNGNLPENNLTLQLLINDSQTVNTWIIDGLAPGRSYESNYQWTPPDGDYKVTAYVAPAIDENYTNNNDTKFVRVCPNSPPQAKFTVSPMAGQNIVRRNVDITFDASNSSNPDWASIVSYMWNFTEGTSAYPSFVNTTSNSTNHKFETLGTFNVILTVTDKDGMPGSTWTTLTVSDSPIASFSVWNPSSARVPQGPYYVNKTLTFNASGSSAAGEGYIKSYLWSFGDGSNTTTEDPIVYHRYKSSDKYNVSLVVTDNNNLINSADQSIAVVVGNPIAKFTVSPSSCYVNRPITFNATPSYDPDNYYNVSNSGIARFLWSFGDGNNASAYEPNETHFYNSQGNYSVSLLVTDSDEGLEGSVIMTVNVSSEVFVRAVDSKTGSTTINHNPGETFTVNITVTNVENLHSYYFNLSWPAYWMPSTLWPDLFDPDIVQNGVDYGGFLGPQQNTTTGKTRVKWMCVPTPYDGFVIVNATLLNDETYSGSGTLATIKFKVLTSGNCTLQLSDTELLSKSPVPIDTTIENGNFYTSCPVANFTSQPLRPAKNTKITFDATTSYNPDPDMTGLNEGIDNYTWDFGDGLPPNTTSSPVIPYSYSSDNTYYVNLTVTDYDGEQWFLIKPVVVGEIDDVAVVNVTLTPVYVSNLTYTISMVNLTVYLKNKGNVPENFSVTVYGDNYTSSTTTVTLTAYNQTQILFGLWNVTGLSKANCTIYANATLPTDTNPSDNTASKLIHLGVPCDLDGDGTVGLSDLVILANAYDTQAGHDPPGTLLHQWNPVADINGNGKVDLFDLVTLALHYGKKG